MKSDFRNVCPVEKAGSLDNVLRRWFQNPMKIISPYIGEGMTVLDVGCGPGFFTIPMAKLVGLRGRVIAVDLQEGMLDIIRQKIAGSEIEPRIVLHKCNQNSIGISERVDFVLLFYMVHEIPDQIAFFREVAHILQPTGQVLIVEPPFHVSKAAFARTLGEARAAGLVPSHGPGVFLSKTAILRKARPHVAPTMKTPAESGKEQGTAGHTQRYESMNRSDVKKYLLGYVLGIVVFLILIPSIIYLTSLISSLPLGGNAPIIKLIRYSVATVLSATGIVFAIWSNIDLLIVGKGGPADLFNKAISPRSKKLVTNGPYRYTRNPMVFGMNALYMAFAIFLNSLSALLFCLFFLAAIILYLKLTEERRLLKDFGDEYRDYKKSVSMIIPLPPKVGAEKT